MKRAFGVVKIILLVLALGCTGGCGKGEEGEVPAGAADESAAESRGRSGFYSQGRRRLRCVGHSGPDGLAVASG